MSVILGSNKFIVLYANVLLRFRNDVSIYIKFCILKSLFTINNHNNDSFRKFWLCATRLAAITLYRFAYY